MSVATLPGGIRRFIARYIPTVEVLETFILLQQNDVRSWTASDIAAELGIATETAADALEHLASSNFLDVKISNDIVYRFNPATAELGAAAGACADFYRRERIATINAVMAASLGPLHQFAEAFRLKKKGTPNG